MKTEPVFFANLNFNYFKIVFISDFDRFSAKNTPQAWEEHNNKYVETKLQKFISHLPFISIDRFDSWIDRWLQLSVDC